MKVRIFLTSLWAIALIAPPVISQTTTEINNPKISSPEINSSEIINNPAINMQGYLQVSQAAAIHRESRRLSEVAFMSRSLEPNTIILDARSRERFNELHIKGAVNLSFPDMAIASLQQLIPDKNTAILIYCNNNFSGAESPFPSKMPSASLNLSTYIALYNYGYRNIYELAPLIDIKSSKLEFESSVLDK
jgi:phage shock protein E